ncbi:MAG: hypothetical protein IKW00_00690 [Clostridia bacterium]|nr:hypothetical protein [Clostridia bacterium]
MNILLPVFVLIVGAALLAAGFVLQKMKFLRKAGCIVLACLVLEGVVFNLQGLTATGLEPQLLDISSAVITKEELPGEETFLSAVTPSGQDIAPIYRTTVVFEDLRAESETIRLDFAGDNRILDADIYIRDEAYAHGFALANTVKAAPGSEKHHSAVTAFDSNGALAAVKIVFETEDASAELVSVELNAPVAYGFSLLRYSVFCLPLLLIAAVVHFKWYLIVFDRKNSRHLMVYAATALVCVLLVVWVQYLCTPFDTTRFPYTRALEYPFEKEPYEYRTFAHALMFDALANGTVEMRYDYSATDFAAVEDPYDPTQRAAQDVDDYMFDYAFYEGKYYCYFGLTPVIIFYAPFYALMGYLPSYTTSAFFFALTSVAAAFLCLMEAARRFVRKPGLVMLCLCAAALTLGSNVLMLQSCADRYHLSIQSMQLFFFLTLYTALRACREKKRGSRTVWFVLSGICTVLLVWSRATGALAGAAFVAPLFIFVALNKKEKAKDRVRDALSFLIPVMLGAAVIMYYNMVRFDSPFEFGQKYQVTTENIAYNTFNLRSVLQAVYYFFLDGLQTVPEFPYLTVADNFVNRTGNYFYGVCNAGAFTMPLTLCIFFLPFISEKRRRGKIFCYGASVAMTVVIAVSGFIVAGVAQRYVCDILPALCLVGALAALDVTAKETAEKRGMLQGIVSVVCAATFAVALAMVFSNYRCFISEYSPDKYLHLFELFTIL